MPEPWKVIICGSKQCMARALNSDGSVKEKYKIRPDVDTDEFTQFTCPHCGYVETWGITRRQVAEILYRRAGGTYTEERE